MSSDEGKQARWSGAGFEPTAEPKPKKALTLFDKVASGGERSGRLDGDREARTAKVEVRCSDAERAAWQGRAEGGGFRSVSDWIRSKLNESDAPKSRAKLFEAAGVMSAAPKSKKKAAKKPVKGRSIVMRAKKPAPKKKPAKKAKAPARAKKKPAPKKPKKAAAKGRVRK